jgi:hypothetical protein
MCYASLEADPELTVHDPLCFEYTFGQLIIKHASIKLQQHPEVSSCSGTLKYQAVAAPSSVKRMSSCSITLKYKLQR